MPFAAVHEAACATKLPIWDVRFPVTIGGKAEVTRTANTVENDPERTSALVAYVHPAACQSGATFNRM
jgi:hypothetical protein